MKPLEETHPNIVAEVKQLIADGLTKSAIARTLDISRDRLRTLMKNHHLDEIYERPRRLSIEEVQAAVTRVRSGLSWKKVAESFNVNSYTLRSLAVKYGHDVKSISAERSKNLWNDRIYGSWSVVPGSHKPHSVDCRCVCGEVRTILISNLISGASQSCGCVGLAKNTCGDGADMTVWTCQETGDSYPSTSELARALNINSPVLFRHVHRNQNFEDALGYTWTPSRYVLEISQRRNLTDEIPTIIHKLKNGTTYVDISRDLKVAYAHLMQFIHQHKLSTYRQLKTKSRSN